MHDGTPGTYRESNGRTPVPLEGRVAREAVRQGATPSAVPQTRSWERFAARWCTILAVVGVSLGCTLAKQADFFRWPWLQLADWISILPAVVLGAWCWWRDASMARWWPVMACAAICLFGLFYGTPLESWRGAMIALRVLAVLPLAALWIRHQLWWLAAQTFVWASAVMMGLVLWHDFRIYHLAEATGMIRVGHLFGENFITRYGDPNRIGGQLAVASLLSFVLYLRDRTTKLPIRGRYRPVKFNFAWTVIFAAGLFATASRTGFAAWLVGMAPMVYWAVFHSGRIRLKKLVKTAALVAVPVLAMTFFLGGSPLTKLAERLVRQTDISTFGSRTLIWSHGLMAWASEPRYTLLGTGTGRADELLAKYESLCGSQRWVGKDEEGAMHRNSHSLFVEWLMSFGLIGTAPALCLLAGLAMRFRWMDRADGVPLRQALLGTVLILGSMAVIYRWECWLVLATLILAAANDAHWARPAPSKAPAGPPATARIPQAHRSRRSNGLAPELSGRAA